MPPESDATTASAAPGDAALRQLGANQHWVRRLQALGPVIGLVLLCIAGALLNGDFATLENALNVITRTSFIGIIAVGMCFVIISGGIDLSVGSMAALIAGSMILLMNALAERVASPVLVVALGMLARLCSRRSPDMTSTERAVSQRCTA